MTCPTCQRHAALETSSEFDDRTGDGISGDSALYARDTMIDECRTQVKGSSNASGAAENHGGARVLHAVRPGQLVHGQSRPVAGLTPGPQDHLRHEVDMITGRFEALAEDIEHGQSPDWSLSHMRQLIDDARQHAGLLPHPWRGRLQTLSLAYCPAMEAAE